MVGCTVDFIVVSKGSGKDIQTLKSIKINYAVNSDGLYCIEYFLNESDYELWLSVFEFHKFNLNEYSLYDCSNSLILTPQKNIYYRLESNDIRLHECIDRIPFLEKDGWNNLEYSLLVNTTLKNKYVP